MMYFLEIKPSNNTEATERGRSGPTKILRTVGPLRPRSAIFFIFFAINSMVQNVGIAEYNYTDVAPLFDQYCVKCHGPDKQKSKFRLDTYERLLTPGSSDEDPIVPGYPIQSPMVEYLLMPKSDEYAMPPEDEDTPTAEEILKIVHWIYHGAKSLEAERAGLPLEEALNNEQLASLLLLRENRAIVHKRGENEAGLVLDLQQVPAPLSRENQDAVISLASEIIELRMAGMESPESVLENAGSFQQLKKLDLRTSNMNDNHVSNLNQLTSLEYLNLFGTDITDTGLAELKVPQSGRLYLGDTKVSEAGITTFQNEHPDVTVIGTVDLEAVIKITEMAQNNSTTFRMDVNKGAAKEITKTPAIPSGTQVSESGIRHSFLVCGRTTAIFNEDSEVVWSTSGNSRDGMVLENGNVLLSIGNEAKEFLKDTQEVVWSYKLDSRNKELGTVNRLPTGNTLVVERGILPRLLEVDEDGAIVVEVPLQPETDNNHMQTRMARKLPNGNYLVPHLLAFKVKEYSPTGKIVRVIETDLPELGGREAENWPFTAILLPNGNTLVNLTHGNKSVEFAPDGSVAWNCDNDDAGGRFSDPCGGQRLPNGNTVIGSYGQKDAEKVKIFEVNEGKEVVWEFFHPDVKAHEIHILTTNGEPVRPIYR
ncbi:MAG: hypothetical protein O3C43_16940 [Verrucomicrobia bacterium]|nr:hypothetical protein [Verrucomicrobiota bacterium]MDA1068176.1 hypothetical protein [Verrucomicrobiota bacterium]